MARQDVIRTVQLWVANAKVLAAAGDTAGAADITSAAKKLWAKYKDA